MGKERNKNDKIVLKKIQRVDISKKSPIRNYRKSLDTHYRLLNSMDLLFIKIDKSIMNGLGQNDDSVGWRIKPVEENTGANPNSTDNIKLEFKPVSEDGILTSGLNPTTIGVFELLDINLNIVTSSTNLTLVNLFPEEYLVDGIWPSARFYFLSKNELNFMLATSINKLYISCADLNVMNSFSNISYNSYYTLKIEGALETVDETSGTDGDAYSTMSSIPMYAGSNGEQPLVIFLVPCPPDWRNGFSAHGGT